MSEKLQENCVSTAVSDNETDVNDQLVTSESKTPLKTPVNDVEVKFIVSDSQNGDAKIDIEHVKVAFAGMAKEELMKYANDPFWVRLRWVLFVAFWLTWVLMFVGAIAIVIHAPRCQAPEPKKWFQQNPIYEIELESFTNSQHGNYLENLKSKLNYFTELNIQGVILSEIIKYAGDVRDFFAVSEKYGSIEQLKTLAGAAKAVGIHLILSLVPNHSSKSHPWFIKSVARESPYDKYYVWAASRKTDANGTRSPPNNWLSVTGGSAWTWNEDRQEFYLHQFNEDQPDFNFHNPDVLSEFDKILDFWLDTGISGFRLLEAQYLLEDEYLNDEAVGNKPGTVHDQYEFYSHSHTYNIPRVGNILSSWRTRIQQKTDNQGILIVDGPEPIPEFSNQTTVVADLSYNPKFLSNVGKDFSATDLYLEYVHVLNNPTSWHGVQTGSSLVRVAERFGEDAVDPFNMITLLLPGSPVTYYGEELGLGGPVDCLFPWDNATNQDSLAYQRQAKESHFKVYKQLLSIRNTPSVLYGGSEVQVLNDTVFAYTRMKSGNPGYLVAYNPTNENVVASFTSFERIPEELLVLVRSTNFILDDIQVKTKLPHDRVPLPAKSALVLSFVPKAVE